MTAGSDRFDQSDSLEIGVYSYFQQVISDLKIRSVKDQDDILKATVLSELGLKYPASVSFRKKFLKTMLRIVEEANLEMSEQLIETYSKLLQERDSMNDPCFKIYSFNSHTVICKENQFKISAGTTGLRIWSACLNFCYWLSNHTETFLNENIVELGSGTGLLGILCAKMGARVLFTDCESIVLDRIRENLEINSVYNSSVTELNWENPVCNVPFKDFIIVASDVIYDPSLIEPLINTIKLLHSKGCKLCMIATTIRNPETFQLFLNSIPFKFEILNLDRPADIHIDADCNDCKLVKIDLLVKSSTGP